MKIMIVTDAWEPQVNGVVRTLKMTTRHLQEMGHSTHILSPIAFACRKSPRPSRLPTKMPPALPRPRDRHTSRSLTILAMELAATASAPKCPMITVYMVKPHPHTNSLPSTGRLYFQKSFCNGPSGCSTWPSRR